MKWRNVALETPEGDQEVLIVHGDNVLFSSYTRGIFYYYGTQIFPSFWMPKPIPPKPTKQQEKAINNKFYMVWKDEGYRPYPHRHNDIDSAKVEASMLAKKNRARYFVLGVVGAVEPLEPPVEYTEI